MLKGSEIEHGKIVETVLKNLDYENLALKISKLLQKPGELVGTSPFGVRGQSKDY